MNIFSYFFRLIQSVIAFFLQMTRSGANRLKAHSATWIRTVGTLAVTVLMAFTLSGCASSLAEYLPAGFNQSTTASKQVEGTLDVYVLNIGQGDSILIRSGNDYSLIDTGDVDHRDNLVAYLKKYNVTKLKNVIITHPHADHLGGFYAITKAGIPIEHVYDNGASYNSSVYNTYMKNVDRLKIPRTVLYKGDVVDFGNGATFTVYAPWEADPITSEKSGDDVNNNSIVGKLEFGKFSMLFTGDAERLEENRLIKEQNTKLSSRFLKVGHHGSNTSSQKDFLRSVRAETAVISVGEKSIYGHPADQTIKRLKEENMTIYSTFEKGTVQIHTDGNTWQITTDK
ncbi:ComEC/Rec2 family competence protein [Veillonella sp.]|uniref:ComEC/Rec2 family competence protein n=1 Tax=Veillonella sp. TaxID=1926307 RepID=UPI00260082BC|nr:ComEC/Rec2 family competence protein [Veillonella sp.]